MYNSIGFIDLTVATNKIIDSSETPFGVTFTVRKYHIIIIINNIIGFI